MKKIIKKIILKIARLSGATKTGRYIETLLLEQAMKHTRRVVHDNTEMMFVCPNPLTRWRADTFSEKEPETLSWIDGMTRKSIFWDVGANMGLYSIYAAKRRNLRVFSFEPSIFNLELLGRNISLNALSQKITIVPVALSDQTKPNLMKHSQTTWGGALSSFGVTFDDSGNLYKSIIEYDTLGFTADYLVYQGLVAQPDYIKIDVDGIEHLILSGARNILMSAKSLLVEINDNFSEQAEITEGILRGAGFSLEEKRQSPLISKHEDKLIFNQIWVKSV